MPIDQSLHRKAVAKLTRYDVKESYEDQFHKLLSEYVMHAIVNESNIMAEAYYEQENPFVLWIIERWGNKTELTKSARAFNHYPKGVKPHNDVRKQFSDQQGDYIFLILEKM